MLIIVVIYLVLFVYVLYFILEVYIRTVTLKSNTKKLLKEANDQCDEALKTHLFNYAHTLEETLMEEATTVSPVDKHDPGIVSLFFTNCFA